MRRFRQCQFIAVALLALSTWTCGSTATTPTTTTTTPAVAVTTDIFTGQLTPNGGITYSFTTVAAGTITATLTTIGDDGTLSIGLQLGTMSGTTCSIGLTNDTASQGSIVTGSGNAAGTFCARVYDAGGHVTTPANFSITVTHS